MIAADFLEVATDLYDAAEACERYFIACAREWAMGNANLTDITGRPISVGENLDELCDIAGEKVAMALAKARAAAFEALADPIKQGKSLAPPGVCGFCDRRRATDAARVKRFREKR